MAAATHKLSGVSLQPASAGQLAESAVRMEGVESRGRRSRVRPKEKGLHTGRVVQADDAMQEMHVAEGCEQV